MSLDTFNRQHVEKYVDGVDGVDEVNNNKYSHHSMNDIYASRGKSYDVFDKYDLIVKRRDIPMYYTLEDLEWDKYLWLPALSKMIRLFL